MKTRYFIQIAYKGTRYHGWQVQPNAPTVQETINRVFQTILKEDIEVTGAGRTDTGVHATYFVAHFDSGKTDLHTNTKYIYKINQFLPNDIVVNKLWLVKPDAHSRFDAISRTYKYYISQKKNPFLQDHACFFFRKLDLKKMNEASQMLFSYQDFTSFSKLHTDVKTNNCQIMHAGWEREKDDVLIFTIQADRFLRNMVRAIAGTLIEVGLNKISPEDFCQIIERKDRSLAGMSVPAHGLFLTDIAYPSGIFMAV